MHHAARIEALGAEFSAPERPAFFDLHPVPVVQAAQIHTVTDIPTAVAVIVLHALPHRRIIVAVHAFDHAVGVFAPHGQRGHGEKLLHFIALHEAVRFGPRRGERLVDERDENAAGVGADQMLHRRGLAHALVELVAADVAEERQIGLQHEPQPVACFVDLALDRMLGQAEEIHIRQLGQQDVVVQARGIAAEDAEIEVAHGVGSSQHDLPSVEPEFALGLGGFVLLETPQTELPMRRVEQFSVAVDQFDLRLIKPRRFQIPKFCLAHRKGEREEIPSAAHAGGFGIGIVFLQVAETSDPAALALVRMVDVDLRGEILAVDRDEQ